MWNYRNQAGAAARRANKVVQDESEVREVKPSRRSSARPRTTRLRETAKVEASEHEESKAIIVVSDDDEEVKPNRKSSTKSPSRSTRPHTTTKMEISVNEKSKGLVSIRVRAKNQLLLTMLIT